FVQIEGLEMAAYLTTIRQHAPEVKLIYDAHNVEYDLQDRIAGQDAQHLRRLPYAIYSRIQTRRLERFEAQVCREADRILAVSGADAQKLRQLDHRTPVTVIPNAIDTSQYIDHDETEASIVKPALVFTGKMDFRPNVDAMLWFADQVLPIVREAVPGTHLTIVGKSPHPRLEDLRGKAGVTVTGFVPAIQPYIKAADVFVAPLLMGSGTRLKVLEAMSMRRAIVSTRLGAEGIDIVHREHALLADSAKDFAESVIMLLQDAELRERLGRHAFDLVREQYDWEAVLPRLLEVYRVM
ncbi:MAG: glycosyltransferase, partial [Chloroflexi bacterium]|nr:glycosyltransferase [Chloroflexota bacterium]